MADDVEEKIKQLSDVRTLLLASIVSAMALVVGLFWNDAIKSTIEQIVPQGESLFYKYVAAVVVTIIVAVLVYVLVHGQKLAEERLLSKLRAKSSKKKEQAA